MRLLITGGLGFVGTNLLLTLKDRSNFETVTVVDVLRYTSNPEIILPLSKDRCFRFIRGDTNDRQLMEKLIASNDLIINLAGETFVDNSIKDNDLFIRTNILGVYTLLDILRETKGNKKLIHVSTDEVWGELGERDNKFTERSFYSPRNPYSASKASADHLIRAYANTYKISFNILYCSNLYGPWQYPEKFIPKSIVNLLLREKIPVYGNGLNRRTWLSVRDAVNAVLLLAQRGMIGESYAVGSNDEYSNLEVARSLLNIFKRSEKDLVFVPDRPGHDFRYAVDFSKINHALGWKPKEVLGTCLKEEVRWFRNNKRWWQKRASHNNLSDRGYW